MAWPSFCCPVPTGCHTKQVFTSKTKYGFNPIDINVNPSSRRWLTLTQFTSWSGPNFDPDGAVLTSVIQIDRLSGVQTVVSQSDNGGRRGIIGDTFYQVGNPPPGNATVSYSATSYDYTDNTGYTHTQQLTDEYADAQVFADAVNLVNLTGGWDAIPLDSVQTMYYDSDGQPQTTNNPGPVLPLSINCLIPDNPYGGLNDFQAAGCSGRVNLACMFMRFYTGDPSDRACVLVNYTDAGAGAPLPPLANTCTLTPVTGTDASGPYIQILPTDIVVVDDVRYYQTGTWLLNPYTNPNRSPLWTCNCDNPAP